MTQSVYELIALGARYAFAALMVLIVARAWRITLVDSHRAQTLRRLSPETGLSGELVVTEGDGQVRRGMKYPVIREGLLGSARRADIRIRHGSVRRRHAYFQLTPEGLSLRSHGGAPMRDPRGRPAREMVLRDGDRFAVGRVRLMLVLTDSTAASAEPGRRPSDAPDALFETGADVLFETDPDALFAENPLLNRAGNTGNRAREERW